MTKHSWNQQYKEPNEYYDLFKKYLKDRNMKELKENHSDIEIIANKWYWDLRALDYDKYNNIVDGNKSNNERNITINKRLEWLEGRTNNIIDDNTITDKEKIDILFKITKTESILFGEKNKNEANIKKSSSELKEYYDKRFNFESEKQKHLEQVIKDYEMCYISKDEYDTELLYYPTELVDKTIKRMKNPLGTFLDAVNTSSN